MPGTTDPEGRPAVNIDKGEGDTPAVNKGGPEQDRDKEIVPGNLGWDTPSSDEPENLAGAVRMADDAQNGEPAALPSDAAGAD